MIFILRRSFSDLSFMEKSLVQDLLLEHQHIHASRRTWTSPFHALSVTQLQLNSTRQRQGSPEYKGEKNSTATISLPRVTRSLCLQRLYKRIPWLQLDIESTNHARHIELTVLQQINVCPPDEVLSCAKGPMNIECVCIPRRLAGTTRDWKGSFVL